MNEICPICKNTPLQALENYCRACKPITRICCTSAEEGIKYGIPGSTLADLIRARDYERKNGFRISVLKALERGIAKAAKASQRPQ